MHLHERIKHDLLTKGRGEYTLTVDQFDYDSFDQLFEEMRPRHCYNSFTQTLDVDMPLWIHGLCNDWFKAWLTQMVVEGYVAQRSLYASSGITLRGFTGRFYGRYAAYSLRIISVCTKICSVKEPDCFITSRGIWPGVTLEVGYSETYNKLLQDADIMLEGSQGKIHLVILVKLVPPGPSDTHFESGFVELHEYNPASGTRRKRGQRRTLYPIPRSHARQRITLQWDDIIRDNTDLLLRPVSSPPPPLMLDDLRRCVEFGLDQELKTREYLEEL
ncbi:hypothetical protein BDV27DRAFT_112284 [Aspergillus caelatus]|uniref:Uncharacterized protein n=1 Tax=Aspergillus caelatus TaxID=61420 RepID=A0A5N7A4N6_9EURO|nr:uncharacterized protein BDV27DRAFT_112284 [Aspergillus caelatus]KAE8364645.1 hypothetical protein BDV27DRAFT_112284 [Aspergillus caelatus]